MHKGRGVRLNPDRTKGQFFEKAINQKKLIYFTAHHVATLPITLEWAATPAATVSDGPFARETRSNCLLNNLNID